jgi:hypothetical protein
LFLVSEETFGFSSRRLLVACAWAAKHTAMLTAAPNMTERFAEPVLIRVRARELDFDFDILRGLPFYY